MLLLHSVKYSSHVVYATNAEYSASQLDSLNSSKGLPKKEICGETHGSELGFSGLEFFFLHVASTNSIDSESCILNLSC